MTTAPLKIDVPAKLPHGVKLLSTTAGITKIRELAAVHELGAKLELEIDLFATYARAHLGGRFCYAQVFGSVGEAIGLLFICSPESRDELAFTFRTQTKTDNDIDRNLAELETLVEMMGAQYYRAVVGDPNAQIRVVSDFELQEPTLLTRAKN